MPVDDVPTLRGPRIVLRPPLPGEEALMAQRIAADPLTGPRWSADPETLERWFADEDLTLLIAELDGEPVGVLDFAEVKDPEYRSAGIDIGLLSCCVGKGLGTEALQVLAAYLIDVRGHHRLTIDPAADNARAIRAYEKVGFRPIGIARQYERLDDGVWHDGLLMDMLADELVRVGD